eukprot:s2334_g4.t1
MRQRSDSSWLKATFLAETHPYNTANSFDTLQFFPMAGRHVARNPSCACSLSFGRSMISVSVCFWICASVSMLPMALASDQGSNMKAAALNEHERRECTFSDYDDVVAHLQKLEQCLEGLSARGLKMTPLLSSYCSDKKQQRRQESPFVLFGGTMLPHNPLSTSRNSAPLSLDVLIRTCLNCDF